MQYAGHLAGWPEGKPTVRVQRHILLSRASPNGGAAQSVAFSGNQWQSVAIGGNHLGSERVQMEERRNQWQSVAISGNQWQSVAISGNHLGSERVQMKERRNQWQSVAISGNQLQSVAISGNQAQSVTISGNHLGSERVQMKEQGAVSVEGMRGCVPTRGERGLQACLCLNGAVVSICKRGRACPREASEACRHAYVPRWRRDEHSPGPRRRMVPGV